MMALPNCEHRQRPKHAPLLAGLIILALVCIAIAFFFAWPQPAEADDGTAPVADESAFEIGEVGGYLYGETSTTKRVYVERRFTEPKGGRGFAAEEANNFIDRLKGYDAEVVGYNNEANGPDRRIVNRDGTTTWIQDKYYSSARDSVSAAFDSETGQYRYMKDGKPMKLEVPSDQYDDAVKLMREKIEGGNVLGVTDPAEAENLVRRGSLSYKQAVNLTRAGTIESLTYDAARGTVTSACAFGISFGIDFILCLNAGLSPQEAASEAATNSALAGGAVFASEVITSQLMKTGASELLAPSTEAVARWLGKDACEALVSAAKGGATNLTREELAAQAAKIIRSKVVFSTIFTAVLTVPDAIDLVNGRMSKEQFIRNLAVVVAAIAAAEGGAVAGTAVLPVPVLGTTAGAIIGGLLGAGVGYAAADVIADQFFKGDANAMYEIVTDRFAHYCEDYVVGPSDGEALADKLNAMIDTDTLKDMFASEDREAFADEMLRPLFEEMAQARTFEEVPGDYTIRTSMLERLQGVVFVH